jgi:hypothetical protein
VLQSAPEPTSLSDLESLFCGVARPDQETLLRAIEDARRILGEYIEAGQSDGIGAGCCGWSPTVTARKAAFSGSWSSSIGLATARLGDKAGQIVKGQIRRARKARQMSAVSYRTAG